MKEFRRKKNRLPKEYYKDAQILSITICCAIKKAVFNSREIVNHHFEALKKALSNYEAELWAYCFMPDHVHFPIEGHSGNDVLDSVKLYKQTRGYHYKQKTGHNLWHKSWFDHVLRRDEDIRKIVHYIFENPIRRGLTSDFRKYPFLGTDVVEIKEYLNFGSGNL